MKILSIEPTPSPNTMKINIDETLPAGVRKVYTPDQKLSCPPLIQKLLDIPGVRSIFHVADFLAIERKSTADWKYILSETRAVFGEAPTENLHGEPATPQADVVDNFGEVRVFVQKFRNIPMQIKLETGVEQIRVGLPERFARAAMRAKESSKNVLGERQWVEQGVRYGSPQEIGEEVALELDAAYDEERLENLVALAYEQNQSATPLTEEAPPFDIQTALQDADWRKRYAALQQMKPTEEDLPLVISALHDENASIRRLAVVYLGDIRTPEVLPHLYTALQDESVAVRRTAGDTLSDIGDPAAIPAMIQALQDKNKLVRWRAARFLYEVGDESALPALLQAQDDPEFEVSMQVKMALARIEGGEAAEGSVWQQMTRRNE